MPTDPQENHTPAAVTAPATDLRIRAAAMILCFSSGTLDAFAFQQLGGIFTANMTGNVILSGLFSKSGYAATLVGSLAAIAAFMLALYLGFILTRPDPLRRPVGRSRVLVASIVLQAAAGATWLVLPPSMPATRFVMVVLLSMSLAMQTVWATRHSDLTGITTTYVTGAMTTIMRAAAEKHTLLVWPLMGIIVLLGGALAGTLAILLVGRWSLVLPLITTSAALIVVDARRDRVGRGSAETKQ